MEVILVNYNGLPDTMRCLRSLQAAWPPGTTMVDNASFSDPTPELAITFPWCHLIRSKNNGGWAGGNNLGIKYALDRGAELIVLLNNDTVVASDFVARILAAADAHPDFGIIGPVIRFLDPPHEVQTDGCLFNDRSWPGFFQRKPVPLVSVSSPVVTEVEIVNGCCMMVRADVFRRIGLIDERFFLIHEESDFCLRARQAGFRCGVFGEALVWHKGSSSFKRTGKPLQRYYDARNLLLLLRRHAGARPESRGLMRSLLAYLRYCYHRYCIEQESGQRDAAEAVLVGLHDALMAHFGPDRDRQRPALAYLRGVFEGCRRWRNSTTQTENPNSHADAIR